jgi:SAM-dependent methyltransferase
MLQVAGTGPEDIVYDLGSGDGRIVVAAVRDFGARLAVGVDIDPRRVREGRANAARAGVGERTRFVEGDVFAFDFSQATVLTMYLFPSVNRKLRPRILAELRPGTRVVSHRFLMGEWVPDRTLTVADRQVYFWVVPANVGGQWTWAQGSERYDLDLRQEFQKIAGVLHAPEGRAEIANARLVGRRLSFEAALGRSVLRFRGTVAADAIEATIDGDETTRVILRRKR